MTPSDVAQGSVQLRGGDAKDAWVDPRLADLCRRAAARGTVLLRNDGALPLPSQAPVAVFGRVQVDWFAVGYGSGGDVNAAYTTTLLDSLVAAGVAVDEELAAEYRRWCAANPPPSGEWGQWPRFFEEMPIDDEAIERAAQAARTAIVVVGRAAGEDRENVLEPGSFYLTGAEESLLERVGEAFESMVVVVNTGNVMDLSWADRLGAGALILAWPGGMEGARALADALTGAVEPGGRLTSAIAHEYQDYPSAPDFGAEDYNNYSEDVFVGYRFFETFAPGDVQFPFGFGLGYTTWRIDPVGLSGPDDSDGRALRVRAAVTNTGERSGSTVVQVYAAPPIGQTGMTRPERSLVGFARTPELEPGARAEVEIGVPMRRLAVFDDNGVTGCPNAWVLEAGSYPILVGGDVQSTQSAGTVEVAELEVVRQCEEALAPAEALNRMVVSRDADGVPMPGWQEAPTATVDLRARIEERLPQEVPPVPGSRIGFAEVVAGRAGIEDFLAQLSIEELADLTFGDITMDSPLGAPGNAGALGGVTPSLRSRGIPAAITTDGPSGLRLATHAALLPCGTALASTWDTALIEELAGLHGQEMVAKGSDILLAPGMNIHRNPLCGRNFEYFSEDPLLTGLCAAAVVRGIQSQGVAACPKHFAANNQETARTVSDSRVSARALREIYLRGFEICVEEAAPRVIMTSYNKINGQWAHYNYDLVSTILRREWGYAGLVITDWWMRYAPDPLFPGLADSATRVRAGVDVLMPGGRTHASTHEEGHDDSIVEGHRDAGLALGEVQASARRVLELLVALHR